MNETHAFYYIRVTTGKNKEEKEVPANFDGRQNDEGEIKI